MKHYDITQWTDFARGLVGQSERAAMEAHTTRCRACARRARLLSSFAKAARQQAQYEPPPHVTHLARAIYLLQQPEKVHLLSWIPTRLVFDSFREPLPAGIRAEQRMTRQALYEAGEYALDLRVENERSSPLVTLVGQVVNRKHPHMQMEDIPVVVVSERQVVARTVSNKFGEFQLEYEPRKHLHLYVPVDGNGKCIEVPSQGLTLRKSGSGRDSRRKKTSANAERKPK